MQTITRINDIKISTRKVRLVADAISDLSIPEALDSLSVIRKRSGVTLEKALKSAVANAENNSKLDKGNLVIKSIDVTEGPSLKRFRPSTRGRVHKYVKRTSNIRIVLEEKVASMPALVSQNNKPAEVKAPEEKKKGESAKAK
jgi:large subunit ribosomal protein L22